MCKRSLFGQTRSATSKGDALAKLSRSPEPTKLRAASSNLPKGVSDPDDSDDGGNTLTSPGYAAKQAPNNLGRGDLRRSGMTSL